MTFWAYSWSSTSMGVLFPESHECQNPRINEAAGLGTHQTSRRKHQPCLECSEVWRVHTVSPDLRTPLKGVKKALLVFIETRSVFRYILGPFWGLGRPWQSSMGLRKASWMRLEDASSHVRELRWGPPPWVWNPQWVKSMDSASMDKQGGPVYTYLVW